MADKKVTPKQQACVNRYISKAYDRINLTVPKGQKALIQEHAASQEESVNGFIQRAIKETMERDTED
jgi:uncharacterized protein (DUF1778 family)